MFYGFAKRLYEGAGALETVADLWQYFQEKRNPAEINRSLTEPFRKYELSEASGIAPWTVMYFEERYRYLKSKLMCTLGIVYIINTIELRQLECSRNDLKMKCEPFSIAPSQR